ncbi:MAG: hypothetical protein WCK65_09460 [Rhodospirillaceae bacterium]
MRKLLQIAALTVALAAAPFLTPTAANAQAMQAGTTGTNAGTFELAAIPSDLQGLQNMPTSQAAAILGGGAIGGYLAETLLEGGLFTVAGVLIGVMVGNTWYEKHYWPF